MYCSLCCSRSSAPPFSWSTSAIDDGHAGPSHAACCYIAAWELGCLEQGVGCCKSICVASSRCPEGHDYVLTKQYQPSQTPQGIVQPLQTTRRRVTGGRCNTGALCILFPSSAPTSMHSPFMSSVRVPMGCTTY